MRIALGQACFEQGAGRAEAGQAIGPIEQQRRHGPRQLEREAAELIGQARPPGRLHEVAELVDRQRPAAEAAPHQAGVAAMAAP